MKPRVLALDEPLGALDKKLREQMQLALMELHRELGMTMIYVTHDQEEALSMSSRVAVMAAGSIEQYASPDELYHRPRSLYVFEFVGRSLMFNGRVASIDPTRAVTDTGMSGIPCGELTRGARCVVCVRPERVTIDAHDPGREQATANSLAGVIRDRVFHGQTTHYIIELTDETLNRGRRIEASVLSERADAHLAVGIAVSASFAAEAAFVFPAAGDAGPPLAATQPSAMSPVRGDPEAHTIAGEAPRGPGAATFDSGTVR